MPRSDSVCARKNKHCVQLAACLSPLVLLSGIVKGSRPPLPLKRYVPRWRLEVASANPPAALRKIQHVFAWPRRAHWRRGVLPTWQYFIGLGVCVSGGEWPVAWGGARSSPLRALHHRHPAEPTGVAVSPCGLPGQLQQIPPQMAWRHGHPRARSALPRMPPWAPLEGHTQGGGWRSALPTNAPPVDGWRCTGPEARPGAPGWRGSAPHPPEARLAPEARLEAGGRRPGRDLPQASLNVSVVTALERLEGEHGGVLCPASPGVDMGVFFRGVFFQP